MRILMRNRISWIYSSDCSSYELFSYLTHSFANLLNCIWKLFGGIVLSLFIGAFLIEKEVILMIVNIDGLIAISF